MDPSGKITGGCFGNKTSAGHGPAKRYFGTVNL